MNVAEAIAWAKKELVEIEETEASASSEIILIEVLGVTRNNLWLLRETSLTPEQEKLYRSYIQKRKERLPTAYILGKTFFRNEELKVNQNCLIPRSETELLVEKMIDLTKYEKDKNFSVLDLCAGSGAIGISLLREFSKAKAVFSDLSEEALAVVDENLRTYGLEGRAKVIKANLFDGLGDDCFDVIMSNPPYFATKDWQEVEEEVLKEPRMAFEAGSDGLSFYRSIVSESSKHLNDQGWLYLEVGKGQAEQVAEMIEKSFLKLTGIFKDYQEIERIVVARKM